MAALPLGRRALIVGRSGRARAVFVAVCLMTFGSMQVAAHASGGTTTGADLQVSGSASTGGPAPGAAFTYTFQIKNSGPQTATAATFTDPLNGGVAVGSAAVNGNSAACSTSTDVNGLTTITCNLGDVASGSQVNVVEIATAPTVNGTYNNVPSVQSSVTDPNPANNVVSVGIKVTGAPALVNGPCATITPQNPLPLTQNFTLVNLKATITSCSALTQSNLVVAFQGANNGSVLDGYVFTCNAPQNLATVDPASYTLSPGASTAATCKGNGEVNATQGSLGSTASGIGTATLYAGCQTIDGGGFLDSVSDPQSTTCPSVLATGTYAWSVNVPVIVPPNGNH
jgi:uncharacterized repeat protein (TIGR01451 family)